MTGLPDVSLRLLRAALAVRSERSFRRAGEAIGLSQPSVSAAVADLETRLGIVLFHRTSRNVTPTDAGGAVLADVARIVEELDTTLRSLHDAARTRRGRVVVTCLSSLAGRLMPTAIRMAAERFPEMEVEIRDDVASRALEAVLAGAADLAVTAVPRVPRRLASEVLFEDPMHLALPHTHRLAAMRSVPWRELAGEELVLLATNSGSRALIDAGLAAAGVVPARAVEVSQLATVHGMLEAGMGLSVLPLLALPVEGHPALTSRPLTTPRMARTIRLLWRADRVRPRAAEAFADVLRETAARLPR
jgi:DNA-binding transcriptional LysR family regulator